MQPWSLARQQWKRMSVRLKTKTQFIMSQMRFGLDPWTFGPLNLGLVDPCAFGLVVDAFVKVYASTMIFTHGDTYYSVARKFIISPTKLCLGFLQLGLRVRVR